MRTNEHKHEGGKSSFSKVDTAKLYTMLDLQPGYWFLDVGCGRGEYSLAAAEYLQNSGKIYAIDIWEEGVKILTDEAKKNDISHLEAIKADVTKHIPLENASIDKCLMANVLHGLTEPAERDTAIREICRVLKPQGELILIEWKKMSGPPGPAENIRYSAAEVEALMQSYGFTQQQVEDLGEYFYGIVLVLTKSR